MSAVVALKKGFDWRSYDENFTEQSDEILALYCFYESTDVLTIQEEASLEQGSTFKLQFSVPIRVDELYEDWLTAEVWLSSDNIGDGQICEDQMVDGCVASTSMAAALEHGERANAGNGSVKLNRSISGKNARASISCRFLPDVIFDVSLPCTYPSETAPSFTLSCDWLNDSQLAELCQKLDKIWEDNANMPVIFTWVEWLSANLVDFLDMVVRPATVIITPLTCHKFNRSAHFEDERAISLFNNVDDLIYKFLRHNYLEEIKSFRKSPQTCLICLDEKLGSEFYRLNACKHHLCIECTTHMCRMHAKEGTVQLLECPEQGCGEHISHDILRQCLDPDEFERYERLMLQRALDSMGDVMYCPQCQQPIIIDKEDTHAMCLFCLVDFCPSCKDKWHTVIAFFKSEGATNVSILWKRDIVMTTFYKMSAVALFVSNLGVSGFGEDSWNSTGLSIIRHVKEAFVSKALSGSLLSTVKLNGVTVAPAKSIESIQTAFTVEDANPTTPAPVFKDIKITKVKFRNLAQLRSKKHKKIIQISEVVSNPFIKTRNIRAVLDDTINTEKTDNQVISFFLDQGADSVIIEWQRDIKSNLLYNMNALTKFVSDVDEDDSMGSSGTGVGSNVINTVFITKMAEAFVEQTTSGNLTLATPEGAEAIVPIDSVESIETSTEVSIVQVIVTTTTTTTTTTTFEYDYGYSKDMVLTIHENVINAVAFNPQGTLLASSSFTTHTWNANTGNVLGAFSSHSANMWTYSVAFSPSNVLATGSQDSTIRLLNPDVGSLIRTLTGHTGAVYGLSFSLNNILASCSADTNVKIWNPNNGTCLRTLTLHSNAVHSLAFSVTNPSILASGSYTTMLWNVDTGEKLFTLAGHAANMITFSCAFSSSNILATASQDQTVNLWNPDTGTLVRTLTGHSNVIYGVSFSPSGLMATGSADSSVKLWNPETGVCLSTLIGHGSYVRGLAFSSTGVLASCSGDTNVILWSIP